MHTNPLDADTGGQFVHTTELSTLVVTDTLDRPIMVDGVQSPLLEMTDSGNAGETQRYLVQQHLKNGATITVGVFGKTVEDSAAITSSVIWSVTSAFKPHKYNPRQTLNSRIINELGKNETLAYHSNNPVYFVQIQVPNQLHIVLFRNESLNTNPLTYRFSADTQFMSPFFRNGKAVSTPHGHYSISPDLTGSISIQYQASEQSDDTITITLGNPQAASNHCTQKQQAAARRPHEQKCTNRMVGTTSTGSICLLLWYLCHNRPDLVEKALQQLNALDHGNATFDTTAQSHTNLALCFVGGLALVGLVYNAHQYLWGGHEAASTGKKLG